MEYDPERALWRPNRRFFLFGLAAAGVAPFLPDVPDVLHFPISAGTVIRLSHDADFQGLLATTRTHTFRLMAIPPDWFLPRGNDGRAYLG